MRISDWSSDVCSSDLLKMPRALEILDATLRRIEQGQIDGIEALAELLGEELSLRENRRIKAALRMARLPVVETVAGYDFRSAARRVGAECGSTGRSWGSRDQSKKIKNNLLK